MVWLLRLVSLEPCANIWFGEIWLPNCDTYQNNCIMWWVMVWTVFVVKWLFCSLFQYNWNFWDCLSIWWYYIRFSLNFFLNRLKYDTTPLPFSSVDARYQSLSWNSKECHLLLVRSVKINRLTTKIAHIFTL